MEDDAPDAPIPTYMTQAILATLLAFPLTGYWAIAQSAKVITLLDAGDREGARRASREARRWIRVSIVLGVVMVLSTILGFVGLYFYLTRA